MALEINKLKLSDMRIKLDELTANIQKTKAPSNNQAATESNSKLPLSQLNISNITIENTSIDSNQSAQPFAINHLNVHLDKLHLIKENKLNILPYKAEHPVNINIAASSISAQEIHLDKPALQLALLHDELIINQLTAQLFKGQLKASAKIKLTKKPEVTIHYLELDNIDLVLRKEWFPKEPSNTEHAEKTEKQTTKSELPLSQLDIKNLKINNLYVSSELKNLPISLFDLDLDIQHLALINKGQLPALAPRLDNASVKMSLEKLLYDGVKITAFRLESRFTKNAIELKRLHAILPGGSIEGSGALTFTQEQWPVKLVLNIDDVDLNNISKLTNNSQFPVSGLLDLELTLSAQMKEPEEILQHLNGAINIQGKQLAITNIELDKILSKVLSSQKLDVIDVAAFATLGPVGLLYSQVGQLGTTAFGIGSGKTEIAQLNINADINDGIITFHDSALATTQFLIALTGQIDLPNKMLKQLQTGILNEKGCAELIRTVNGPFEKPDFEVMNTVLGTAFSPITNLFSDGLSILGKECDVFYQGEVSYPDKGRRGILTTIPKLP